MVVEAHGVNFANSNPNTVLIGCKIQVSGIAIAVISITKHASTAATKGYVYSGNGTAMLVSGAFSGDVCTFDTPYNLNANTSYYLMCDADGASYTRRFGDATLPIAGSVLNWTDGWNGGDTTGELFGLISTVVSGASAGVVTSYMRPGKWR